jgi:hypothetical protein
MNVGPLMQEVPNSSSAALTITLSDCTALAETAHIADVSSFFILWSNSRRSKDPSEFAKCAMCSVITCSNELFSPTDSGRRGFVRMALPFQTTHVVNSFGQGPS